MRDAVERLKNIIAKKDIVPELTHFVARDGFMYASDGILSAATPIQEKASFAVKGSSFEKFIKKTPGDLKLTVLENFHVKVSCGRFRATIPGSDPKSLRVIVPNGVTVKVKPVFLEKIRAVRPFLSDNATQAWAASAYLRNGAVLATNNVVVVKAEGTLMPKELEVALPFELIDELLRHSEGVEKFVYNDSIASFVWADGSWVSCSQRTGKFPDVQSIFDSIPKATWQISPEWRESFLHIADLTEGEMRIFAGRITAGKDGTELSAETAAQLPEGREFVTFNSKFAVPVIDNATYLTFFESNGPRASFRSPHIVGMMAGMGR